MERGNAKPGRDHHKSWGRKKRMDIKSGSWISIRAAQHLSSSTGKKEHERKVASTISKRGLAKGESNSQRGKVGADFEGQEEPCLELQKSPKISISGKFKKVHKILEFEQERWMKEYIEMNTQFTMQAKSKFEKDFVECLSRQWKIWETEQTFEFWNQARKKGWCENWYQTHSIWGVWYSAEVSTRNPHAQILCWTSLFMLRWRFLTTARFWCMTFTTMCWERGMVQSTS